MKHIKLLLTISLLIGINKVMNAQTFYKDSTNIFYFTSSPSVTEGWTSFPTLFKDSIILDSVNNKNEEFYRFEQKGYHNLIDSAYHIKVKNKQVFYTGYMEGKGLVNNQLIYDFNFAVGDTFSFNLNKRNHFKVDSIKTIVYLDGIARKTHYYKLNNQELFIAAEGIGSFKRPIYFNEFSKPNYQYFRANKVIAVCRGANNLVYFDGSLMKYRDTTYAATCEATLLKNYVRHASTFIHRMNKNTFAIYPNPTNKQLNIKLNNNETGSLKLTNTLGQILYQANFEAKDNLQLALPNGIKDLVYVTIQTQNYTATKVVLVE